MRDTAPDNVDQLRNIAVVAKGKVKGRARVDISGTDNDWNEIRNILITTCGQRNDSLIIAELSTATQGDLSVRDFFNLIRDMMMDLILAKTNGLTVQQAAAEELNIKAMGLQRFIDGLHTDLSTYTAAKAPANLSDALKIALEREKSELKKQNTVVNDQLVTKQDMFDMLQKLVLKDERNQPGRRPSKNRAGMSCYNCNDPNHLVRNCPPSKTATTSSNLVSKSSS